MTVFEHELVSRVRERVYLECDAAAILERGGESAAATIRELAASFLAEERRLLPAGAAAAVVDQVVAATLGLGPLQRFLEDPEITEIMVNGPAAIFIERNGVVERTDASFSNDEHVMQVLDRILAPIGRRVDSLTPMVDARLPDGSRVNAVIPPLSLEGPTVTIRRFAPVARTLDDLDAFGAFGPGQRTALEALVADRCNVLVSGATSSGKTTLLAALVAACSDSDRIVVIEDSAELPLAHPHRVRLEARPPTFEGRGEVRVRDLVRNALRMRPDRLIVGEVRGPEAFDLVQALNTGHSGCWSTVHANGPLDALMRIESMALTAGVGVPQRVLRTQIARAIDAVVHLERADGKRRVSSVALIDVDGVGEWQVSER